MEKLTKEIANIKVDEIKVSASDDEVAHSLESNLRDWFIKCISYGMYEKDELIELANIINSTSNIEFSRWFA